MRLGHVFISAFSLSLSQCARANIFYLKDQWRGEDFFQGWNWVTEDDPTHGRVNYVSEDEAISKYLAYAEWGKFIMRADDWSIVNASARGRDSVRIYSENAYDEAIVILDLAHIPAGCATWPAFWTLSEAGPWPAGGEVDIIEGFNLATQNHATLHTSPGCTIPPVGQNRSQTGTDVSDNCDASLNFNQGCSVLFSNSGPSFGVDFNYNGGGYYVMSRSRDCGIQVWFWPRYSPNIPPEVLCDTEPLDPNPTWGEPAANFPMDPDYCDYDKYFDAHQIVFDLTLCGDAAGNTWASSGCQRDNNTCVDFVNNNPTAFSEAYWEINSLRVYTPNTGYQQ